MLPNPERIAACEFVSLTAGSWRLWKGHQFILKPAVTLLLAVGSPTSLTDVVTCNEP